MANIVAFLGEPSARRNPPMWEWVKESKALAIVWTAMRVWLGIRWIQAGAAKLWGPLNPAFLHRGGAGVVGLAAHGHPAYSWWGSFAHGFVVPNAGWIAVLVAVSEFAVGVALVLGLFTRLAALASLALLFTYMMSGSAGGVLHALFAVIVLTMWRTSSWIGIDGLLAGYRQRHPAEHVRYPHLPHIPHPHLPWERDTAGTAGERGKAA